LAGEVDLLIPNRDEAVTLAGASDPRAAARALCAHAREVVVTLGAEGAVWTDGSATAAAPAAAAGPVADTTGAGDAFTAGFLAAWLRGAAGGARRRERAGRPGDRGRERLNRSRWRRPRRVTAVTRRLHTWSKLQS